MRKVNEINFVIRQGVPLRAIFTVIKTSAFVWWYEVCQSIKKLLLHTTVSAAVRPKFIETFHFKLITDQLNNSIKFCCFITKP